MKAQIVSFHCVLKTKLGKVISSTFNHDVITRDGSGSADLLAGLARGLQDLRKGEKRLISLQAHEAYGFYDPRKVLRRWRDDLPDRIRLGGRVLLDSRDGRAEEYRVTEINEDFVILDGNHPLAGEDLIFEIEATAVREATVDEIESSMTEETTELH